MNNIIEQIKDCYDEHMMQVCNAVVFGAYAVSVALSAWTLRKFARLADNVDTIREIVEHI